MSTLNYAAATTWPKVIIVGDPSFGDTLASLQAQWVIQPVVTTVSGMWDAIESGQLDPDSLIVVITDGTASVPDELEATLAAYAPFAHTFLIADPTRGEQIVARAQTLAPTVPNGDPSKPIWVLPNNDTQQAINMMRRVIGDQVAWDIPAPPQAHPPAPKLTIPSQYVTPAPGEMIPPIIPDATPTELNPQTAGLSAHAAPQVNPQPATPALVTPQPEPAPQLDVKAYEQAQVYSDEVLQQANAWAVKPANARPGQMTISSMSSKGGSGKCLAGSSQIMDPVTGVSQSIEDLVLRSEVSEVVAFDGRFMSTHRINDKIFSGRKETFTVRFRSGREITATGNHPFLTTAGWVPLSEIQVGETLANPARIPHPSVPQRMDSAELDLLAILLAEGGTTDRGTRLTNFDPEIISMADSAAKALGAEMVEVYPGRPGQYRLTGGRLSGAVIPVGLCQCGCGQETKPAVQKRAHYQAGDLQRFVYGHYSEETTLRRLRREHGLDFVAAKNKTMPQAVYRLPADQLARFLALFWMCDGYAVAKGGGDLGVTLASKPLIKSLQHLLLRFGIISKIGPKTATANGRTFPAWRLTVYSNSYSTFKDNIPLWGEKAASVSALSARTQQASNPNVGSPTLNDEVYNQILSFHTPGLSQSVAAALEWNVSTSVSPSMVLTHKATKRTGRKHLNLKGLRVWAEQSGPDAERALGWIYDSEIFWDEIDSITPNGVEPVYDIEVPGPHNFIANDVIVHNSTSALLLAATIAKASAAAGEPKKVVLVDLDTRDGQVASLIGQYMPTSINIRVMPNWDADTVTANLVHDKRLGIDALLAPVRPRNADDVGPDFYRHIIGVLQTTHDVVVLDCSVNYLDPLLGVAFAMSDEILFVTTLATTSVQGMARSLTELFADPADGGLGIPREKVGIVANQVINNVGMGKDKLLRAALGAPLVGQIPSDQDAVLVATNSNRMHDLLEHPRIGPAVFKLAVNCLPGHELAPVTAEQAAKVAPEQPAPKRGGLFRR